MIARCSLVDTILWETLSQNTSRNSFAIKEMNKIGSSLIVFTFKISPQTSSYPELRILENPNISTDISRRKKKSRIHE